MKILLKMWPLSENRKNHKEKLKQNREI